MTVMPRLIKMIITIIISMTIVMIRVVAIMNIFILTNDCSCDCYLELYCSLNAVPVRERTTSDSVTL